MNVQEYLPVIKAWQKDIDLSSILRYTLLAGYDIDNRAVDML